jgi:hypothetical protein
MSIKAKLRLFHRQIAPWFLPFLLLSAATGLIYRIGRAWFAMSKETGGKIMHLHSGEWLGDHGSVVYLLLTGGVLLFLIFSGIWMCLTSGNPKPGARKAHRVLSIVFSLPLILTAVTGIAYQAGGKWFHADEATLKLLMSLHQGTWLGNTWRPFYILFIGIGLIAICLTGLRILIPKRG